MWTKLCLARLEPDESLSRNMMTDKRNVSSAYSHASSAQMSEDWLRQTSTQSRVREDTLCKVLNIDFPFLQVVLPSVHEIIYLVQIAGLKGCQVLALDLVRSWTFDRPSLSV